MGYDKDKSFMEGKLKQTNINMNNVLLITFVCFLNLFMNYVYLSYNLPMHHQTCKELNPGSLSVY